MSISVPVVLISHAIEIKMYYLFDMLISKIRSIIISELKLINKCLFSLKSPEKQRFSNDIRENKYFLEMIL